MRGTREQRHVLVSILTVALLSAACAPRDKAKQAADKAERPATRVETVTLERTVFDESLELNGVTEPIREASVVPEIPGRIVALDVVEGESVEQFAPVLVVDTSSQRARIDSIRVQIEQLDRDVERAEKLIERGLATKAGLEQLQAQRATMRKSVKEVQVGARQAHTRAPIGGIVTKKMAEPGEFASPGVPVARIVDISTIVVRVGLPERDIPFVSPKQTVTVRIEATGEVLEGTLALIGIEANAKNRTFPVEIHVANPQLTLRAGMRATVTIVKRRLEDVVMIPRDAVLQAVSGQEVFVIEGGVAKVRKVKLGAGFAHFAVVESGLVGGEELVVRGHRAIVHEEPIQVASSERCCASQLQAYATTNGPSLAQASAHLQGPDAHGDEAGEDVEQTPASTPLAGGGIRVNKGSGSAKADRQPPRAPRVSTAGIKR